MVGNRLVAKLAEMTVCEIKFCVDQPPPLTQGTYTIDDEPHQLVKRERSLSKVSRFQLDNQVDLTVTTNLHSTADSIRP